MIESYSVRRRARSLMNFLESFSKGNDSSELNSDDMNFNNASFNLARIPRIPQEMKEKILGYADIRQVISISKIGKVAGKTTYATAFNCMGIVYGWIMRCAPAHASSSNRFITITDNIAFTSSG